MSVLFDNDHETGDLSEYDATATGSGDVSVTAAAALVGSYGVAFVVGDTTEKYARMNLSGPASGQIRWRFYIDPNSMTVTTSDKMIVCRLHCTADPYQAAIVRLEHDGANYQLTFRFYDDAGSFYGGTWTITDEPHYVEVLVIRATNSSSADGEGYGWIDGVLKSDVTDLDNYDVWDLIDYLSLHSRDQGSNSGTYYMDDFKANDDGGEIGPAGGAAGISIPVVVHHLRQQGMS
jgi:hypothetical protein